MAASSGDRGGAALKLSLILGALGIATGLALYAFFPPGGKSLPVAGGDRGIGCTADSAVQAKLDAKATGQMAAFTIAENPSLVKELSFVDSNGEPKSIADWSGRTVLLNLWATWCAPCRAEMPALEALNREMGGAEFEVVAVSVDLGEAAKPKAFYKEIGLKDLAFFHDPEMTILNNLKSRGLAYGLPATVLIDRNGCVLGSLSGPAAWESNDAKELVRQSL